MNYCDAHLVIVTRPKLEKLLSTEEGDTFWIFYKKDPDFEAPDAIDLSEYELVTRIKETDLENVFSKMQGENWSPNGEYNSFVRALGLQHTSMSVGDVVYNNSTGELWITDRIGFKKVGIKSGSKIF